MVLTFLILFSEQILGFYPFGKDPRQDQAPAWDSNQVIPGLPKVVGDEHIKNYRGTGLIDTQWFGQPTTKTPDGK